MSNEDVAKIERYLLAIHRELDQIWMSHGLRGPERIDSGGTDVVFSRDDGGRLVIDRGGRR
jgi:hypothetical protein